MKILLIGSGGREHSLAIKLTQSARLTSLYTAPGNPGTAELGENIPIQADDIQGLAKFAASYHIDLTIVGPEVPLVLGIVDLFKEKGLKIIGPNKAGAQLEGSKNWAKKIMKKYHIPTADFETFTQFEQAKVYIKSKNEYPVVIKADGLAAGKGVTVAQSETEAVQALENCFIKHVFKDAGARVVIESFLPGQEASILAFTDGKTILQMAPAQDHKAVYDGDKGPNTGGMGAYSPTPLVTKDMEHTVLKTILTPLIQGLNQEGIRYKGIVYAGLMIHNNTARVVEFNVRFGDPETQVVLPRLKTDLIDIFEAIANETLDSITLEWSSNHSVCVVLASKGYPGSYEKGAVIHGQTYFHSSQDLNFIQAGTIRSSDGQLLTDGGRVLGVVATGPTLESAIEKAYKGVAAITFKTKYFRTDIGKKALN
ncbi:phosphoribosylamine--glycine ligase [Thermoproteota archaeon]